MFDLLNDIAKGLGVVAGTVAGVSFGVMAAIIGVPVDFVKSAVAAGCETQEEIREWIRENKS